MTKDSVVDRLTDASRYTGAHKERFDGDGHGRGIAGRRDADTSDLSNLTRPNLSGSAPPPAAIHATSAATHEPKKLEKFGTQAAVPLSIMVWKHGDKFDKGEKVMLKNFKTLDQLKVHLATKLGMLPALRGLYTTTGAPIKDLPDLEDKGNYVAVKTGFKFDTEHLPTAMPK